MVSCGSTYPMTIGKDRFEECEADAVQPLYQRDLDKLHPVKLNGNILEANGFTKETVCNGEQRYLLHIDELCIIWANLAKSEYDIQTNKGRLQDVKLDSVHEFQHALQLMGLNDFAEDFKITKGGAQ